MAREEDRGIVRTPSEELKTLAHEFLRGRNRIDELEDQIGRLSSQLDNAKTDQETRTTRLEVLFKEVAENGAEAYPIVVSGGKAVTLVGNALRVSDVIA